MFTWLQPDVTKRPDDVRRTMSASPPVAGRRRLRDRLHASSAEPLAPPRRVLPARLRLEAPEGPRGRGLWLVAALVAAVLVCGLAMLIDHEAVQHRDLRLLVQLHDALQHAGLLNAADEVADWVSQWLGPGPHLIPLTVLVAVLALRAGRARLALFLPLAFALGVLGEHFLKDAVGRVRPNLYPSMAVATGPSFPSGHAVGAICAVAAPLVVAAWLTRRAWLRWSLLAVAVLAVVAIDLARLVLAVHYPTDVLAGNLLGLGICAALAGALGLPLPRPAPRTASGSGVAARLWQRIDPVRPEADPGVEGNRRLTSLTGAVQLAVLAVVILSGVVFGSAPGLHLFSGFVAIPLTLLKLGSTGHRFVGYYLRRHAAYRTAGPPTVIPRLLAPLLVASAVVALATGVVLFFQGTRHGTAATLHTDSAVVFIVLVLVHVAVHARTAWVASAAEVRTPRSVPGGNARWALLAGATVAGLVLAAGLTLGYPWSV
jgi:undecaprenyl-diphosphatase